MEDNGGTDAERSDWCPSFSRWERNYDDQPPVVRLKKEIG